MYKVLICGSRYWHDANAIERELEKLVEEHGASKLLVIHGGARGADTLADVIARELNILCARVDALWGTQGRGAGPQRNAAMLALAPDEVLAFHENVEKSKGTLDMVTRARKEKVILHVFSN